MQCKCENVGKIYACSYGSYFVCVYCWFLTDFLLSWVNIIIKIEMQKITLKLHVGKLWLPVLVLFVSTFENFCNCVN